LRAALAANRAQFYLEFASGPFYGLNRPNAKVSQAVIQNWFRQGMIGGAKAHYDGIKAFSETDQTEDLKGITVPTLVLHGDDDQVCRLMTRGVCRSTALVVLPALSRHAFTTELESVT
jgi:non-heme chloroperoxidase